VVYATNDWSTGFSANVSITNTGPAAINGWTLRFTFPGNQQISQGWSATWTQSTAVVTATNLSYNGALAAGASVGIGFNATFTGTNTRPTSFTLNGATCTTA
jgi:cellulase/cellobiase CelA1